jgi:hypothetical protein
LHRSASLAREGAPRRGQLSAAGQGAVEAPGAALRERRSRGPSASGGRGAPVTGANKLIYGPCAPGAVFGRRRCLRGRPALPRAAHLISFVARTPRSATA